jgi:hypothetical protein
MIDEDAFGILFSYFDVEDDEYGSDERAEFVERFEAFERTVLDLVARMELGVGHHILCLGHAIYVEVADGEHGPDLLSRVRRSSALLTRADFVNVTVLSHGGRWVTPGQPPALSITEGPPRIAHVSRPSEPLRRALDADTMARPDDEIDGWGPGLYADTEALAALGKAPKNAPTVLRARGAQFYRIPPVQLEP